MEKYTKVLFKNLPVGAMFHTGTSRGAGIHSDVDMQMEYRKINKSKAECIAQVGYFNERAVGHEYSFAPFKTVYVF